MSKLYLIHSLLFFASAFPCITSQTKAAVIAYESFDGLLDPGESIEGASGLNLSSWTLMRINSGSSYGAATAGTATVSAPGPGSMTGNALTLQSTATDNVYAVASFLDSTLTPGGSLTSGTFYFSMMLDLTSDSTRFVGMTIQNGSSQISYWGIPSNTAFWGIGLTGGNSATSHDVDGLTHLVLRVDLNATTKNYSLYVNPVGDEEDLTPVATTSHNSTTPITGIGLGVGNGDGNGSGDTTIAVFDEIMVATDWSDVVNAIPEPGRALLLLTALGCFASRRKRGLLE